MNDIPRNRGQTLSPAQARRRVSSEGRAVRSLHAEHPEFFLFPGRVLPIGYDPRGPLTIAEYLTLSVLRRLAKAA